jgi:thiol-disulfide isomerase/thioredoxin
MPALAGGTVRLSELKGKVVVLNFWATWCPPCRAEMPALEQAQSALGSKGLLVLGVNQMEDASVVASFMRSINLDFAIALDANGAVSRAYRVSALPTTFFIDRDGVIRDVVYGGPMTRALIESKVAPLLGQ